MIKQILHTIQCHKMLEPNDKVIIGLSGGADSMALAFFLNSIKNEWNLTLQVAHVNHGIRGDEAKRDEDFVVDWCEKNSIHCEVLHADVPKLSREKKIGLEVCGRNVRYEFFYSFGNDWKIATAHNLNDCIETVLLNMARGTSTKGICGIPPVRGNVIRPLIDCSRTEIENFCKFNSIDFVVDSTNLGNDYSRNLIRNKVVPVLKDLNPLLENAFSRLFLSATIDMGYLETLSNSIFDECLTEKSMNTNLLNNENFALRSRVIERYLKEIAHVEVNNKLIMQVDNVAIDGGRIQIDENRFIKKFKDKLICEEMPCSSQSLPDIMNKLNVTSKDFFNNKAKYEKSFDFFGDYDKIRGNIKVRSRQEGDKITIVGRNCTKSLKKFFNEIGIYESDRGRVPVLVDDDGIVAVVGYAVDKRVAVNHTTKNVLLLKLEELK